MKNIIIIFTLVLAALAFCKFVLGDGITIALLIVLLLVFTVYRITRDW